MTHQVYMYSFYPDLFEIQDINDRVSAQKNRDQEHLQWMLDHSITMYPKSTEEYQKDRPLFTARTKGLPYAVFFFSVRDHGNELYCKVVSNGQWSTHASINDAQRTILKTPSHAKLETKLIKIEL